MEEKFAQSRMYQFLVTLVLSAMVGFQAWRTLLNNFAKDIVSVDGLGIGIVQSLRELPGFLVFLVVYLLLVIKEHRLAALSVVVMGIGIAVTGLFPSLWGLVATTVLMSTGFHYFETTNKSLTLQYFSKTQAPLVFARLRSLMSLGNIAIGAALYFSTQYFSLMSNYLAIGLFVFVAGVACLLIDPIDKQVPVQKKTIVLKKKYWLFYVLNLLSGARRQIFVVFAVFMLVERYDFTVKGVAVLFVINNVIGFFINPLIGRAINKYGERKVLSFEYAGLFFVFLGYAYVDERLLVALLYVVDHIFFNFHIGINTYLQKIADPEDIAPSASVGFAINHITAVTVPLLGGYFWLVDYRIPYIAGAILSLVSLSFVQKIKVVAD